MDFCEVISHPMEMEKESKAEEIMIIHELFYQNNS